MHIHCSAICTARIWAGIAQSLVRWARSLNDAASWFPPCSEPSDKGDSSLGLSIGSESFPKYKLRSSPCRHAFHRIDSKDPDIHVIDECLQQKHMQHTQSTRIVLDKKQKQNKKTSHTQKPHTRRRGRTTRIFW